MRILLAILGIVLLVLAGLNVRAPHFSPEWFGLAALAAAYFWADLVSLG